MATPKSLRRNPGWKLEPATIDIVSAARTKLNKTAAQVIHLWAMEWQNSMAEARTGGTAMGGSDVKMPAAGPHVMAAIASVEAVRQSQQEKPMAARVETPYQIERRERLERLRVQLAAGGGASSAVPAAVDAPLKDQAGVTIPLPFPVMVNGERHTVIEFKGRRVLTNAAGVMLKNLTPQETAIYWQRHL